MQLPNLYNLAYYLQHQEQIEMNNPAKRDDSNNAKKPVHFRTPFNYNPDEVSEKTALHCLKPTRTQQHQKDDTDINVIVQRFGVTGMLPQAPVLPTYGDFEGVNDYQTAMNLVIQAQQAFDALPAKTRQYFNDDPAALLTFIDASPDAQLVLDLGLGHIVSKPTETPPPPPPPAPPAPPANGT